LDFIYFTYNYSAKQNLLEITSTLKRLELANELLIDPPKDAVSCNLHYLLPTSNLNVEAQRITHGINLESTGGIEIIYSKDFTGTTDKH